MNVSTDGFLSPLRTQTAYNYPESTLEAISPQSLTAFDITVRCPPLSVPPSLQTSLPPSPAALPEPFATAVRTNGAPNGELDLLPCTLHQYLELSNYTSGKYELLDDHLFFKRDMDDSQSGLLRQSLAYKLRQLYADGHSDICVYENGNVHLPGASSSSSTSALPSSRRSTSSVLVPDISIMPFSPRQSPQRRSPRSAAFVASYTKQAPLMNIEITGEQSSRRTDFTTKWVKYAEAGVEEYVIIDRDMPHAPRFGSNASPSWRPCVVVGKLHGPGPFRTSGYPTESSRSAPRRSARLAQQRPSHRQSGYHWEIYEGDEPINCSYFRQLELTPNSLFELEKVEQLLAARERQNTGRLAHAEERAHRSSDQKRAAEERARRNSDQKRAAEERARRSSDERRAAEKEARTVQSNLDDAIEKLKEQEQEIEELRAALREPCTAGRSASRPFHEEGNHNVESLPEKDLQTDAKSSVKSRSRSTQSAIGKRSTSRHGNRRPGKAHRRS